MATKKPTEPQVTLEREYIVPLRKEWLKVPEYKRASKAIKALKQFIAKHMKLYDSDLRNVKIDQLLNNEIRFRGMKKPPAKIKVKAKKLDNNTIKVELVNLPAHVKFAQLRKEKKSQELKKKVETKQETKPEPKETKEEDSKDKDSDSTEKEEKDKKTESKPKPKPQEKPKEDKQAHKQQKTTSSDKNVKINRKTLSR
ncbi:hypothetical protein HOE04_00290 [archaeon]|nr:hypothetical protein [archaeon]